VLSGGLKYAEKIIGKDKAEKFVLHNPQSVLKKELILSA